MEQRLNQSDCSAIDPAQAGQGGVKNKNSTPFQAKGKKVSYERLRSNKLRFTGGPFHFTAFFHR